MGRFGAGNKFAAKRKAEALAKVARIRSRKIPKVETGNAASSVLVDKTNTTNGGTPRLAAAQEIASAQSAASLSAAAQQSAQLGDDRGTSTAVTSLAGVSSSTSTAHTLTEATVLLHSGAELLAACRIGDADAAMRLLGTEGIDVNAKDKKDCTPLLWACVKGLKRVALALVHGVISVNAMNVFGMTALHYACQKGLMEVALALIDHKDISATSLCSTYQKSKSTPLHYACRRGDTEVALALIAHEVVNVNVKDNKGKTSLYYARRKKDLSEVVAQLLMSAAAQESAAASAPVDANNLLYAAAQDGHLDEVTKLIAAGADVNARADKYGRTPLYAATRNGHLDVVTKLIAAGANVNVGAKTPRWKSPPYRFGAPLPALPPLHIAAVMGHLTVVTKLIAAGALVEAHRADDVTMTSSATPLWLAARWGHPAVVTKLIAAGARVNKGDRNPLAAAAGAGHLTVVTKLIAAGANINNATHSILSHCSTPLCIAAANGHTAVVSKLLQHGADKSIRGRWTRLEAAQIHAAIVALLV